MIILDTNVVSELMRPNPSSNVVDWVPGRWLQTCICPLSAKPSCCTALR